MESIVPWRQNRVKCSYRPLQRAKMFIPPASTGKMFIPPETWLPAANYALARNAIFSTNLDTKRRVHLERHGSDVTRVNTALAMLGRVHFALVTIATMPPLVHNLLIKFSLLTEHVIHNIVIRQRQNKFDSYLFVFRKQLKYYTFPIY